MKADVFGKGLTNKVSLYVPSTVDIRQSLTESATEEYVNRSLRFLANLFGGATALSAQGAWEAQSGDLVTEQVTIVYAFSDTLTSDHLTAVRQFCEALKRELRQEAVAVEINGELFFV